MKYFIYCRKSTEDEHRQVLSIQSQLREAERAFGEKEGIEIVGSYTEEKSAMKPGRPVFSEMVSRIERGEAAGIIAWAPDRLARNSIDGGRIIYLLDCNVLQDLKFSTYTFENNPQGKFMLQIMFGQSKYYSDALSENVRRGNRAKVELGWRPSRAPLGYLTDPQTKTTVIDPVRFPVVRKMWELMLTGSYNPSQIMIIANERWGFRTRATRRWPGGPIQTSSIYTMFSNEFYAGMIRWDGRLHPGKHQPVVTVKEFETVRALLRKKDKPRSRKGGFTYGGMIRCGTCDHLVTAEQKVNRYGYRYVYYHCAQRSKCKERSISLTKLEKQIASFLSQLAISKNVATWAHEMIDVTQAECAQSTASIEELLRREEAENERRQQALVKMRLDNMIDDAEYLSQRNQIAAASLKLVQERAKDAASPYSAIEPVSALISFSNNAIKWFLAGDAEDRRLILGAAQSHLSLAGKILSVQALEPLVRRPKTRSVSSWRAFTDAIRKASTDSAFIAALDNIAKLEKRAALRASLEAAEKREAVA